MKVKISPKNKKLLKSSKVREWLRKAEKELNKRIAESNTEGQIDMAIALGIPMKLLPGGKIVVMDDFYNLTNKEV